jgi:hypothetical protein
VGCLVSLPLSGYANDMLLRHQGLKSHWPVLQVRRLFNSLSFFGCTVCLFCISTATSPALSMLFLTLAQAISMVSIGGGFEVNKVLGAVFVVRHYCVLPLHAITAYCHYTPLITRRTIIPSIPNIPLPLPLPVS